MSIREKFEDDLAADPLLGTRSEVDIIAIAKEKRDMLIDVRNGRFSLGDRVSMCRIDKGIMELNKVIAK